MSEIQTWDMELLQTMAAFHKPIKVKLATIPDIENILESYCWTKNGEWVKPLTVTEILDHAERVANADLTRPVILTPDGKVADGVHTVIKALRLGLDSVLAIQLTIVPPSRMVLEK